MIGPRHMGSSPTLKRQLSRLSSSSSFQVRQSRSRIYTFLVAGGLLLLATVALLQFHLQGAPQSSKLSPRENGKPEEGMVPEQAMATGRGRAVQSKLGRKLGPVQDEEEESEETMDEMEEDEEEEESDPQALFDIDIDDRMLEEEAEDEDSDLAMLAEMSNDEPDSADEDSTDGSTEKSAQKSSDDLVSAKSVAVNDKKDSSLPAEELARTESEKVKPNAIPAWVLDIKLGSQPEGIVDTLQGFERGLVKELEKKKGSFFWERKKPEGDAASKLAMQHLKGFKDFVESWKERFSSDDELVDDNVQQRLEGVHEIEDALLLNGDKATSSKGVLKKGPSNPMLQDPDTAPGTWMTKTDKEMLRAIRGDSRALLRGNNILDVVTMDDSAVRRQAYSR